jgi:ubiquinone/menaquinone biosynthesis C-methylase UbiE
VTDQHRGANSAFDLVAEAYDRWYETPQGRLIFEAEAACLSRVGGSLSGRWLEVGVGTGRFAVRLGIGEGVDPSMRMLNMALGRGIRTVAGRAEELPFAVGSFDGILLALTLCFVDDRERALRECHRVLREGGKLLVGVIPADGAWGRAYVRAASEGHPVYGVARFLASNEMVPLIEAAGFRALESASTLFWRPGDPAESEPRLECGIVPEAGFLGLSFERAATESPR